MKKGRQYRDITGQKFGLLTAIKRVNKKGVGMWLCECECGNETIVTLGNLTSGGTKSCGCLSHKSKKGKGTGRKKINKKATNNPCEICGNDKGANRWYCNACHSRISTGMPYDNVNIPDID